MKKPVKIQGGGSRAYLSPDVVLLDVAVEQGFAQTSSTIPDLGSQGYGEW